MITATGLLSTRIAMILPIIPIWGAAFNRQADQLHGMGLRSLRIYGVLVRAPALQ